MEPLHNLLFLNSLGTGEIILILLVVLILFGGKKLPELARGLGKGIREFKNASNDIKQDLEKTITENPKEEHKS
ncbi:MAG: Sec-independent protein translocase subunit TatA/TatB [Solitalea-like symbiont of Tyrophagus putrescentiae]